MRTVSVDERRARLGLRHRLAKEAKANDVVTAAGDMVGFHASDPATVYLAGRARVSNVTIDLVQKALYDDRSMIRILGMRRTMFVAPIDLARLIQAGAATRLVAGQRRRMAGFLAQSGVTDDPTEWLKQVEQATLEVLLNDGPAFAQDLTKKVPALSQQITVGEGTKWAGTIGVASRILFLLALDGLVARGRPRGTWTGNQHRWVPIEQWVSGGLGGVDPDEGRREIIRRWLFTFGPGTLDDIRWWSGWTVAEIKRAMADLDVAQVDLDGGAGLVLAHDLDPVVSPEPWVSFLPSLDPTPMGWKGRNWYLGPYRPFLFDRNGNIGPSIWVSGRIVGGWGQDKDRRVVYRLLEDVPAEVTKEVEQEQRAVEQWIGDTKATPLFPTPLEIELAR